jgi:endonuclease-3
VARSKPKRRAVAPPRKKPTRRKSAPKARAKPNPKNKRPVAPGVRRDAHDVPPLPERLPAVLSGLDEVYGQATCELDHKNAFELIVATILSAQCTDKRVNMVTPKLFARYPDAYALAEADQGELEEMVKSTGFFRNKAKNLREMARALVEEYDGQVPRQMGELLTLPGVARKTANVVLGTAFGVAVGVVVDTHVMRLSQRLGLTRNDDPITIERDLMEILPRERWIQFAHQMIWHGRRVCFARKPNCGGCVLAEQCPSAFVAA